MKFKLVHIYTEFNRSDFNESQAWGSYYEPDDINKLVEIGFDRKEVTEEIKKSGWSDEYCFPIPEATPIGSFMYEFRKAIFKTENGKSLDGYVVNSGHCINLYGGKKEWSININLLDIMEKQLKEMIFDLGLNQKNNILPLNVKVPCINHEFTFAKSS